MIQFVVRRLIAASVLLLVVTAATFVLMSKVPDPSHAILGPAAAATDLSAKRHELGLDDPLLERYFSWLGDAIRGDLGTSWFTHLPVSTTIGAKLPITASLALVATAVSAVVGIAMGMTAAVRRGWVDRTLQVLATLGFAIPGVWLALMLVVLFAVNLQWLPATGYVPIGESLTGWMKSLVLPVAAISVGSVAAVAAQTRNAVSTVLAQDYMRTLRSRGLPRRRILLRHVLRNAGPNALTVISLQFISLFGGAIIVEQIFALQGLGTAASASATRSDGPVVLGVVLVGVTIVLSVNLLVDLVNGWLDPKARLTGVGSRAVGR